MNCEFNFRQYNAALKCIEQGDTAAALDIAQQLPDAYREPIYAIGTKRLVRDGKLETAIGVANCSGLRAECAEPVFKALCTMNDPARVREVKKLIPPATTIAYFWRLISADKIESTHLSGETWSPF